MPLLSQLLLDLDAEPGSARAHHVVLLLEQGCTAAELREAHRRQRLQLLPLEKVLQDEGDSTLPQVAKQQGVEVEALLASRRALGLTAECEQPVYGPAVTEHARRLRFALDAGVPLEALLALNRVVARAASAVAAASREAMQALLADAPLDEGERALWAAQAAERLAPEVQYAMSYAYIEHIRALLRSEASAQLLSAEATADVRDVCIAFADLVDFTRLGDGLPPEELGDIARRLQDLTDAALRPGVAVVKSIGDAVMLASADAASLADTVLDLLEAARQQQARLPPLRAGAAAGPALHRAGDWYGRPVNLASRLTSLAAPGTLLADDRFVHRASHARWSDPTERHVRGFDQPVAAYATEPFDSSTESSY